MATDLELITQDIQGVQETFNSVLADRSMNFEREASFAVQHLQANDFTLKIAKSNRQSVINAVTNVAAIGISLNPAKKQAYLVPRKVNGVMTVCLDISYMGLMDLAVSTGSIVWAQAAVVREADSFTLRGYDSAPDHQFNPFGKDRGQLIGVYVVAKTRGGDYLTHTMTIADVYAIRDKSEAWKSYVKKEIRSCPWADHEEEMVKKTCVKQASKYWPDKSERLEAAIHHLNTDGGEAIELSGNAPKAGEADTDEWIKKASECATTDELQKLRRQAVNDYFNPRRDRDGYQRFTAALVERAAAIKTTTQGAPANA
jgi:recombination protein RecT